MRKFVTAGIAFLALAAVTPSQAANYNWNGFYVGGNVGYSWGNSDVNYTVPGFSSVTSNKPKGIVGGGGIGFNWMVGPQWLVGLEADIQATGQKADSLSLCLAAGAACIRRFANATQKLPWFGTFRGRIGFVSASDWLLYGTGGLAWGSLKTEVSGSVDTVAFSTDASSTKAGWTIGGGVEKAISQKWTVKVEYLYVDLGTISQTFTAGTLTGTSSSKVTDNILRIGVNFKF